MKLKEFFEDNLVFLIASPFLIGIFFLLFITPVSVEYTEIGTISAIIDSNCFILDDELEYCVENTYGSIRHTGMKLCKYERFIGDNLAEITLDVRKDCELIV